MGDAGDVAGVGSRSPRAFVDVYEDRYDELVRIARLTTGSFAIAEELVQEAFADLYRRFAVVRRPDAYVQRAVVNRCTSWVRRRVTERRYLERQRQRVERAGPDGHADGGFGGVLDEGLGVGADAALPGRTGGWSEPAWSSNPATVEVMDALQSLPARQRAVVVLRYLADWSEADVAAALGMRPPAVRSLLARARARLVKELS